LYIDQLKNVIAIQFLSGTTSWSTYSQATPECRLDSWSTHQCPRLLTAIGLTIWRSCSCFV